MEAIVSAVAEAFVQPIASIAQGRGGTAREAVALLARTQSAFGLAEIGTALGIKPWSASHLASAGERRRQSDRAFGRKVRAIEAALGRITE